MERLAARKEAALASVGRYSCHSYYRDSPATYWFLQPVRLVVCGFCGLLAFAEYQSPVADLGRLCSYLLRFSLIRFYQQSISDAVLGCLSTFLWPSNCRSLCRRASIAEVLK